MEISYAIEVLKNDRNLAKGTYDYMYNGETPPPLQECIDAMDMAISALEKHIPQRVRYNNRHGDGPDLWNKDYFNCPSCGRRLRNKKPDPYCPRCAQALTWEVTK
jgi:transposase-like protein